MAGINISTLITWHAYVMIICNDTCDSHTDTLNCVKCAASFHFQYLVKRGREKAVKKIQGTAPV